MFDKSDIPAPARTTNVAAARPSKRLVIQTSQGGPLPSAPITTLKLTIIMLRTANARAMSNPRIRCLFNAVSLIAA